MTRGSSGPIYISSSSSTSSSSNVNINSTQDISNTNTSWFDNLYERDAHGEYVLSALVNLNNSAGTRFALFEQNDNDDLADFVILDDRDSAPNQNINRSFDAINIDNIDDSFVSTIDDIFSETESVEGFMPLGHEFEQELTSLLIAHSVTPF